MISSLLIGFTIIFLIVNLYYFFTNKSYKGSYLNSALMIKLFLVLTMLTFGFAFLYYLLSLEAPVLKVNDPTDDSVNVTFGKALYFSGVTILSVGYGDFVPIGSARFFSLIQASLGLLLPAAYVMKALSNSNDNKNKDD
ncbi:metal transporter [Salipaludibacillus keqinensis]|uniref:Metal transporter n=1 Tax=Salipaludibacillus keqinensis TaxID=2045207 RepID=A0A323T949_9BACI|nr:potassium channel family protein [Salipaludibacillus keqinensis]PYZ91979.1 metal transporter [Salipaludibacillus keqinensis]